MKQIIFTKIIQLPEYCKPNKKGMEMVQVAILVAIAIGLGMLFRERISDFITSTFDSLANSNF